MRFCVVSLRVRGFVSVLIFWSLSWVLKSVLCTKVRGNSSSQRRIVDGLINFRYSPSCHVLSPIFFLFHPISRNNRPRCNSWRVPAAEVCFVHHREDMPGTPLPVIPRQMEIVHKPKVAEPNSTSMRGGEWKLTVTSQLFVIFQA